MRFRKKPVVIDAILYDGTNAEEVILWCKNPADLFGTGISSKDRSLIIPTLEGDMTAQPGDWIIRGVKNEYYPCKPDIFEATYERVADDE